MSPDRQTLEKARAGDAAAFAEVVDSCYASIFRFAMKYTGQRQDAEDVAQQACIKLAHSIASYRFESAFSSWLYVLVLNCARDWHRQQSRHRADTLDEDCGEAVADSADESRVYLRQVLDEVDAMGSGYRDTLVLVASEGLSHREAAELLGVKESTVSWRLHEIRKRLASAAMREDGHD
ncbi:RNA polymerase sigma factor [Azotobacter sp. CWF10]